MRLLLDENLSESLLRRLADAFPESAHVRAALGDGAADERVWQFARDRGYILVTLDEDFERLSIARGAPPKVVWLGLHNAGNAEIAALLQNRAESIARFVADPDAAFLALRGKA